MVLKNIFYKTFSNSNNIFQFKKLLFSTTSDKDNNFYEMDENSLFIILNGMTVKQLKKLCKEYGLHKYNKLTKKNLVDLLSAHFLSQQVKMLEQTPLTSTEDDLPLILNENNQINISVWYKIAKQQRPKRWLESKAFNDLVDLHCRVTKKTRDEVIVTDADGDVYVDLLLALITAAQFKVELKYKVYKFYVDQYKHQEATIKALRYEISLSQQGIFLETITRWETFSFSFAYYIIYINNTVKCGIVGGFNSKEKSDILLDLRLASHRDTYAKFELINVFQFTDSQAVTGFEMLMKTLLKSYSIGRNGKLEQYEIRGKNTAEFINEIVTTQFQQMNSGETQIGIMCPNEKIDKYNKSVNDKVINLLVEDRI